MIDSKPLRVEELAEIASMGISTLHHHFRMLTAMSPLQYQKQLRLQSARNLMLNQGFDAASAAFEVGYESAVQSRIQPLLRPTSYTRRSSASISWCSTTPIGRFSLNQVIPGRIVFFLNNGQTGSDPSCQLRKHSPQLAQNRYFTR